MSTGFVLALLLLLGTAYVVLRIAGVNHQRGVITASLRAAAQLALVALALRGVFAYPLLSIVVIAVMFTVAVATATRRIHTPNAATAVALGCAVGAGVTIGIIFATGALPRNVRTLVAVSGIVIGGTLSASTLTGRRLLDGFVQRREEIEAWLSIGAPMRRAVRDVARTAIYEALVPALDQTRTVGLVTLPGAFVGALIGGGDASFAARFQLVVLVGLLCAEALTACLLAFVLADPTALPPDPATATVQD